jgi:flagellar basal body P-ring formation protein FlgA
MNRLFKPGGAIRAVRKALTLGPLLLCAALHAASPDIPALLKSELQRRGAKFDELHVDAVTAVFGDGLEVTQIQYDPVHAKTYFQLRDNRKHSFEVGVTGSILFPTLISSHELAAGIEVGAADFTVDYRPLSAVASPSAEDLAGRQTRRKIAAGEALRPEMFSTGAATNGIAALVQPGRPATMKVQGPGYVLSRQVIPLDAGGAGQTVRVRAPETNRIVKAVVVDRDQLKGEPQ